MAVGGQARLGRAVQAQRIAGDRGRQEQEHAHHDHHHEQFQQREPGNPS